MDTNKQSLELHKKNHGKISVTPKIEVNNQHDMALVYTPGVAAVSRHLAEHKSETSEYTWKGNSVAVISDGSAVLGLGNIGPEGALPVMEGKCLLFKRFANIDAVPIVLSTQDANEIIRIIESIAPTFGGINLEDISAPKCFHIEAELRKRLSIPVVHDDQWGAAVVTLAGLLNALKVVDKQIEKVRIVISGAGAAGSAIVKIIHAAGAKQIVVCDRNGIIHRGRTGDTLEKQELAMITNPDNERGSLIDALANADIFIGVSKGGTLASEMVQKMATKPIVFGLANPIPEIMPEEAKKAGAYIVATGRSDYPNQINNSLVFPGVFRGALDHKVREITLEMLIRAAHNLAAKVQTPSSEKIIPTVFEPGVMEAVASAIA